MGHIHIMREFYSYPESTTRTLRIYTPDQYDEHPDARFPVLYMFDGQNVFSHPESALFDTWCANTTMEMMIANGSIRPWIIVGIDHLPDRLSEYSPWPDEVEGNDGNAPRTADAIVNHIKPFIDSTYRTLPEAHWTAVMGASMGGLMSLYLGREYPHIFGRIGGVSPSIMWSEGEMFRWWTNHTGLWTKIWLDTGSEEKYWFYDRYLDYVTITENFYRHMKSIGYQDHEFRYYVDEGAFHNEIAWQQRLPLVWAWLLAEPEGI